jgi:hypothetical protein
MQRRPQLGRPQLGRPRRKGRTNARTRAGIAASALVLAGGAAAVVLASHGSAPAAAQSASFNSHVNGNHPMSEWSLLNSAMDDWGSSRGTSLARLASVSQQTLSQATQSGKTVDEQRGIVVFATQKFLILESRNGSLHLWVLSGKTQFANVSSSMSGTTAMTASNAASGQAMSGTMIPAVNMMAGGTAMAQSLLTPSSHAQTVTIQVTGTDLTVTVTITKNSATMWQSATMPNSGFPMRDPSTMTMSAWSTAGSMTGLSRGDLALVVGTRSHGLLHASIVLFAPLSRGDVGGSMPDPASSPAATATPTVSATPAVSATPSPSTTVAGTHW